MTKYVLIALLSGVLSAVSQILLKKSTMTARKTGIWEYLNPWVIGGYALVAACMVLMVIAFRGLPLKYGAALESLVYFYVMVLGRIFLGENLTQKRVIGNLIIVCGVAVFSL